MRSEWLPRATLRAASFLAPGDQRAEWLAGWRSELWYVPRRGATRFCLGAFRDALWLRRNHPSPAEGAAFLASPFRCLAFLAAAAAASALVAMQLPGPRGGAWPARMTLAEVAKGSVAMLVLSGVLLPALRLALGRASAESFSLPWRFRLRRGVFMALKVVLLQPMVFCGTFIGLAAGSPALSPLALWAIWILPCRWALTDQRRRCPVCLRLLTAPVRIGAPSSTFLEWYGAESLCARGHGMLQTSDVEATYSAQAKWLRLDDSWSGLFLETAGRRRG